ncbi:MAG: MarR family transcriptional regulator, partial [Pseudonocardia sp.]|nr:MarR family transcriptional regulator [Pseudonocardia sp.]
MTDVEDDLRTIAAAIHVLSRTLRRAAAVQVGLDPLPGSEFDVVQHIGGHPGSTVSDVARDLGMQTSNVSTAVRHLAARDLVDRVPDAHDQRRIRLWPSAAAERHR